MDSVKDRLPKFKDMGINVFTLSFKGDLENSFIDDYYKKSIYQVRISFLMTILLYGFFGLLDKYLPTDIRNLMWLIRFSVIVPIGLLVFITSFADDYKKYHDITMSFTMILFSIGILVMTIIAPKPVDYVYYVILIFTLVFVYTVIGIRFFSATLTGIIILLCYEFTAYFLIHISPEIIVKNNFIFIGTNLIGMIVAYGIEFYSRRDFFIAQMLENSHNEIVKLNDELEERVKQQTAELVETNKGLIKEIKFRKKVEKELQKTNDKLNNLLRDTVSGLVSAIEYRDPYTAGHQRKVTQLAVAIAEKMNLSPDEIDCIRISAMIHDIGKINVPIEILNKPGIINEYELEIMQNHPQAGYEILKDIDFPWPVAEIIYQHHERENGSGYPNGLKSEDIRIETKVLIVADVVEAMSSHRPYRPSLGVVNALAELEENKGIHFDSDVVDACIAVFNIDNFEFDKK